MTNTPRSLMYGRLLIPFESTGTLPVAQRLMLDREEFAEFLRAYLLYDSLIVPTVDFAVLPVLAGWIGPRNLISALRTGHIKIVRYKGAISYIGNGSGLATFYLKSNEGWEVRSNDDMTWAPAEIAVKWIQDNVADVHPKEFGKYWRDIGTAVLQSMVEMGDKEFEPVVTATYQEIKNNPGLETFFALRNRNLKTLHGVNPSQVRWLHTHLMNDEIDLILHLAAFNWESYMAEKLGAADQTAGPASKVLVEGRHARLIGAQNAAAGFTRIAELTSMPDLSSAFEDDALLDRLLKLRRSREATDFRRWFHENVRDQPAKAQALFYEEAVRPALVEQPAVKALRFIVCGATSLIPEPITAAVAGLGVSAADSFLLGRFLRRGNPKIMIDRLRGAFKV